MHASIPSTCFISTRAPREGSDNHRAYCCTSNLYFYPRSPRGERPLRDEGVAMVMEFLPALPARGATKRYSLM